jgi:hypothetical protein
MDLAPEHIIGWIGRNFEYKKSGNQIRICNPDDPNDKDFHLWISLYKTKPKNSDKEDFWVHDFRPGHQSLDGSFLKFVAKYRKITYKQALREVFGTSRSFLKREEKKVEEEDIVIKPSEKGLELPAGARRFDSSDDPVEQLVLNYLKKRGFSREDAVKYDLHYTADSVIFVYREFGRIAHWQQRWLLGKGFHFPSKSEKGDHLFGFDFCQPGEPVGITEAAFGAMSLGPGVTASGGAVLTEGSIKLLKKLSPSRVVLTPDNDEAGIKSLEQNWQILRDHFDLFYCLPPRMPKKKDWNDALLIYGRERIRTFFEQHQQKVSMGALMRPLLSSL